MTYVRKMRRSEQTIGRYRSIESRFTTINFKALHDVISDDVTYHGDGCDSVTCANSFICDVNDCTKCDTTRSCDLNSYDVTGNTIVDKDVSSGNYDTAKSTVSNNKTQPLRSSRHALMGRAAGADSQIQTDRRSAGGGLGITAVRTPTLSLTASDVDDEFDDVLDLRTDNTTTTHLPSADVYQLQREQSKISRHIAVGTSRGKTKHSLLKGKMENLELL